MNIVIPPRKTPAQDPKVTPTVKQISEVNSTLGGLGVSCIPTHKAVSTLNNAS